MKIISLMVLIYSAIISNCLASEKSLYEFKWLDDGEQVYVIQNKEHIKARQFAFDVSMISSSNSPFMNTSGMQFGLIYYLSENWSVDFTYKIYDNVDSADLKSLLNTYDSQIKPLIRKVNDAKIIHVNWIPFYGKVNTFNRILFFDWGVGLGFGQFATAGNYETFLQKNISITFKDEVDMGFNFKSFLKIYTRGSYTFGIEYNLSGVSTIKDTSGVKELLLYSDTIGTVGYLF